MADNISTWASDESVSLNYCMEEAQLLGRGKFSVVHRTTRRSDGRPVALKRIQVFDMGSSERDECMNEIRLLQSMDHPHIIDYLSCVIEHNELTVVMELAAHGDMAGLIKTAAKAGQPLSEAVVWRHFSQIADALAYMHEKRVMHRDLKPANVFVTETNHVKLGDLGVGRHFSSKTDMVHSTVGTPYYMSPECIQGKTGYDFKSDLWSLGCLLYEMAKLRTPFYSEKVNFYVLGKRITSCQYDPVGDGYSPQLAGLVGKMLQSNPADRPSATEVFEFAREARLEFPEEADDAVRPKSSKLLQMAAPPAVLLTAACGLLFNMRPDHIVPRAPAIRMIEPSEFQVSQEDRLRRTNELVDRLAQSEARASEAEKQAQQKEADLRRKLEELALRRERAVSAVNDDDGDFPSLETSTGDPAEFRFSRLDELRYAINLRSDGLTSALPVAAGLSVAAVVAVGSVALNAKEPSGYGAAVGQAEARSAAPSPPAMPLTGAALRAAQRAARSGAAQGQRSAPGILFGSLGGPGFGAESPIPGREKEYQAFKDQASNQYAGGAAYKAPPIDAERRNRSPGLTRNFYDVAQADFKRPWGMGAVATPEAPPAGFSAQAQGEFGAESPIPGREKEYKAFKDQASNQYAGGAAYKAPPIDAERRNRSPGISRAFYDVAQADFKRPWGMGAGATLGAPEAPPAGQVPAEFGAESPMPGREEEYKAFKDRQASNPIAGRAASPPPPIDADRKKRSPGISRNFYDRSQADFKRPFGT